MGRLLFLLCAGVVCCAGSAATAALYTCSNGTGGTVLQDVPCAGAPHAVPLDERSRDAASPGAGTLQGRMSLVLPNGTVQYGARTPVFLVTRPLPLPPSVTPLAHAYLALATAIQRNEDLTRIRETDGEGHFTFGQVTHGWYFLVAVTNITTTQVFWQVPVRVDQPTVTVDLHKDNVTRSEAWTPAGAGTQPRPPDS